MKIICAPPDFDFPSAGGDLDVVLYGHSDRSIRGSVGDEVKDTVRREKLYPAPRAWDFLSIALSIVAADLAGHRNRSPDGWTREFDLSIAVADPDFWNTQIAPLEGLLRFLTTDRWNLHFLDRGLLPAPDRNPVMPEEDCVVLLSGGLDSFVGALDLTSLGRRPIAVSQLVRGDAEKQRELASLIGGGLRHLQMNHNAHLPDPEKPPSQRARSVVFLAYGVLAATTLARYHRGDTVTLYICENGFISINPPLTNARLGSLSTRTSHPVVLDMTQRMLNDAGLRVQITNPYAEKTKGEMLTDCRNQSMLRSHAHQTTSCGRFNRFGQQHCGRCVPCLIRRAAFNAWGVADHTDYYYEKLSRKDGDHAGFDDVRAAAMAVVDVRQNGLGSWIGATLSSSNLRNVDALRGVVSRGLDELAAFLQVQKVQ
ncbi:MAG: Qat anti-phage system QueC-like protein QatC [Candidatus Sulfotelmatobacter sp.]|jgi:7-cyano-7-deazaguanine synthase in queuosine biosynthesis